MRRTSSRPPFHAPLLAVLLLVTGCQQAPVERPQPSAAAALPALPSPAPDAVHYDVAADESDLRVIVYRGGPLAQFGHNHVLRAGDLRGEVHLTPELARSTFNVAFSPSAFIIDPEDARREEGPDFAKQPSPQAVEGTRANLLGPAVLDAASFPLITLRSAAIAGSESNAIATVRVGLRGVERDLSFPMSIEHEGERLIASGALLLDTPDFGIPPFTVMGGGLKVMEQVRIKFRVVAERVKDGM